MKKTIFIFLLLICVNIIIAQNTFRKKPYLLFQNKLNTTETLFTPEIRDIVILWQLYSLETCTIEWGIEADPVIYELGSVLVDPISGSDIQYKFYFLIDDLIPQTKYYYKVIAPIDNTEEVEVVESSFVSPPPENSSELTFFAYSDTQNPDSGSPSENHDLVCQQINAVINSDLSYQTFILHAGDFNDQNTEDSWQLNYFNNTQVNVRDMTSQLPVMGAYGNHDMWDADPPVGPMIFEKYWPYSYIEPADPINAYNRYYSFDYGPVHVIVLNLPWPNWDLQNYIIEDWLLDDLENSADKWKVYVFHTPGYSNTNDGNIHYPNPFVRDVLQPIMVDHGVHLVLSGHNHYYAHWLVNGIHHLTIGGGGGNLYGPILGIGELSAGSFHHFAKFNIDNDLLTVNIIDNNGAEFESFSIPKSLQICDNENVLWDKALADIGNVRICSGSTLTINSIISFIPNAKIIVERGAKLVLNEGILTCSDGHWQGIEVWGTTTQPQNPDYQGWVQVKNGGTIENSSMGIYTNKPMPDDNNGWDPGYTGGIVQGADAHFINNKVAVQFFGYSYTSWSGFTDCEFVTNDDYIGSQPPNYFAEVTGMNGVTFKNCEFRNETTTPYYQRGIYSNNSYIKVEGKCLSVSQPCTSWDNGLFENLYYGIYATASTSSKYVDISHTDFDLNFRGLYISGITDAKVTSNRFTIDVPFISNGGYGLYLNSSTGYWVEDNDFLHEGAANNGVGLIVNNSGISPNEIYRNRFTNLIQGISAQGQNREYNDPAEGLQILCNDFDVCTSDILIPIPSSIGYGIASNQGSNSTLPQDMAGNLFYIPSPIPNNDYDDINNQGAFFTYYYPNNYSNSDVKPVDYTKKTVKAYNVPVYPQWSYENGCSPGIEGGGTGSGNLRTMIATTNEEIEETENLLAQMIDGGNTEYLNTQVETSYPPEAVEIYNELMNNSPNLSETVVESSIEKETVLPGAMIRDVMVANPHTSKSDKLLNKLDERNNPMPDYMKAQILEGRDLMNMKQELEANLATHKLIKSRAFNELTRYFLSDSVNPQESLDSLIQLYEEDNSLESKYRLAMLKLDLGESAEGEDILESLPVQYGIEGAELSEHQQMETFYEIVSGITSAGRTLLEADSSEVQQLSVLESDGTGLAAMYARNILISLGAINYDEPIQLPDPLKSSKAIEEYEKLISAKPPQMLEVYPNPSKDFVIIGYTTGEEVTIPMEGIIEIQDVSGKVIQTITLKSQKDQVTVLTKDWKSGIYIASLKLNGKIKESIKFTLIK